MKFLAIYLFLGVCLCCTQETNAQEYTTLTAFELGVAVNNTSSQRVGNYFIDYAGGHFTYGLAFNYRKHGPGVWSYETGLHVGRRITRFTVFDAIELPGLGWIRDSRGQVETFTSLSFQVPFRLALGRNWKLRAENQRLSSLHIGAALRYNVIVRKELEGISETIATSFDKKVVPVFLFGAKTKGKKIFMTLEFQYTIARAQKAIDLSGSRFPNNFREWSFMVGLGYRLFP